MLLPGLEGKMFGIGTSKLNSIIFSMHAIGFLLCVLIMFLERYCRSFDQARSS
jgi:hypothetical protein